MVSAYEQKWLAEVENPTQKQLDQQQLIYGMAEQVLPIYFKRWSGDFTGKYILSNATTAPVSWHSLEKVFKVEYTFPDGKKLPLRGRRDGIFIDKRGKYWVFDTKCRSVINHDDACDTLPLDTQQMMYLYVTQRELGQPPAGTVMNIIRRPGHHRGVNELLPSFLERIGKDVALPKKYDHNFVRYEMAIDHREVTAWKNETFDPMMQHVREWWEGKAPHYMNPNALITKYGHCQLYLPIVKKDFSLCYRRDHAFNELTEI